MEERKKKEETRKPGDRNGSGTLRSLITLFIIAQRTGQAGLSSCTLPALFIKKEPRATCFLSTASVWMCVAKTGRK